LKLLSNHDRSVAFSLTGKISNALRYSPCGKYIIYPLGSFVVLKNVVTEKEAFFDGHSSEISCLAISKDGNYLASGQINLMGVKVCGTLKSFSNLFFSLWLIPFLTCA
jgi:WD40 repeat protein